MRHRTAQEARLDELVISVIAAELARTDMITSGDTRDMESVYHDTLGKAIAEAGSNGIPLILRLIHFAASCVEEFAEAKSMTSHEYLQDLAMALARMAIEDALDEGRS